VLEEQLSVVGQTQTRSFSNHSIWVTTVDDGVSPVEIRERSRNRRPYYRASLSTGSGQRTR
jgi:hypothetical protein